ncbi:MAG: tRNA 2-selenouridine(34) synthase MnmH [Bacteroidetes bacterium]|nr:MAG: tRNA 2-selenouridine(34) synthase MnmH [Bacteroidota bacterium]
MPAEKIHIEQFLELAKQHPVIDVRSPGEYNHAHIPGALSMPLFTDKERAAVGTAYKQESREKAIKIGLDFFGPKMKKMVEEVESLINSRKPKTDDPEPRTTNSILVYCWRGGMRSGAVSWLLDLYGFKVYTLVGGYKKFRNYVLENFKKEYSFKILGGYTGSGKTETLKQLKRNGETVIDLEEIAIHKGSAFGNIGLPKQPTQEMFENLLALELIQSVAGNQQRETNSIWLEDESQRIGLVNIPNDIWKLMRNSVIYFLDIPFEERLNHINEEYGQLDTQKMIDAIVRIKERLGGLEAKNAINHLESNNTIESFRILLKYYDKWYLKGLHNREKINSLLHLIKCDSVTTENANRLSGRHQYHENPSP